MVQIVRLTNNEEVIGQIETTKAKVKIKNGAVIVPVGEGRMAMVPWLPHAKDESIEVPMDKVMFIFEPLTELANEYSSKMGSGIVVPPPIDPSSYPPVPKLSLSGD